MHSIKLNSHVGEDGILQIQVPIGITNTDLEVMVIVQPLHRSSESTLQEKFEEMGYSRKFIEVIGSWEGELERPKQLLYEKREEIHWDTF